MSRSVPIRAASEDLYEPTMFEKIEGVCVEIEILNEILTTAVLNLRSAQADQHFAGVLSSSIDIDRVMTQGGRLSHSLQIAIENERKRRRSL